MNTVLLLLAVLAFCCTVLSVPREVPVMKSVENKDGRRYVVERGWLVP
ncbi:hypothetical protein OESDEN_22716 [Oesophagostomum dentatum]|uniref:Uncharacterized protein n=1 Tax=Oesophagostomum dentatum TaxID=61180 RepID=A0A0B1RYC6_OESDE|nr:hypothetical protein OESDEN_22716 [Oesophagostomum dentatum]